MASQKGKQGEYNSHQGVYLNGELDVEVMEAERLVVIRDGQHEIGLDFVNGVLLGVTLVKRIQAVIRKEDKARDAHTQHDEKVFTTVTRRGGET